MAGPNAQLVQQLLSAASDYKLYGSDMQQVLGRSDRSREILAQGKSMASAAAAVAKLPDAVTSANLEGLKNMQGIDDTGFEKIKNYVETGQVFTEEELDQWSMEAEGFVPFM